MKLFWNYLFNSIFYFFVQSYWDEVVNLFNWGEFYANHARCFYFIENIYLSGAKGVIKQVRLFLWAIIWINDIRLSEWILGVRLKKWVCYVLWYISAFSSWTELWIHFETHFSLQKCPEASFPISNTIFRKCVVRVWCQLWTVKNWQPTKVALQNRWDISYHQTCLYYLLITLSAPSQF